MVGEKPNPVSLGHVFGIDCVTHHFDFRRDCPKCRTSAEPGDIRRIFLDGNEPAATARSTPNKDLKDVTTQLATMKTIIHRAEQVDVNSSDAELSGLVQAAERVVVQFDDFQSHFSVSSLHLFYDIRYQRLF